MWGFHWGTEWVDHLCMLDNLIYVSIRSNHRSDYNSMIEQIVFFSNSRNSTADGPRTSITSTNFKHADGQSIKISASGCITQCDCWIHPSPTHSRVRSWRCTSCNLCYSFKKKKKKSPSNNHFPLQLARCLSLGGSEKVNRVWTSLSIFFFSPFFTELPPSFPCLYEYTRIPLSRVCAPVLWRIIVLHPFSVKAKLQKGPLLLLCCSDNILYELVRFKQALVGTRSPPEISWKG